MINPAEVSIRSQPVIIRTCRHRLPIGRRCLQPAVAGRACCRHHLDAQSRFHTMARARRRSLVLRLRVPETARDLDWNRTQVNRVLATERVDPDALLMIHWALDLSAAALRAVSGGRLPRARNSANNFNGIYDVAQSPLLSSSLNENPTEVIENTSGWGEGGATIQARRKPRINPVDGEVPV